VCIAEYRRACVCACTSGHFTGPIPSEIGHLVALTRLHLQENSFTGARAWLKQLMVELITDDMNLRAPLLLRVLREGAIPTEIGCLTSLVMLGLGSNLLTGGVHVVARVAHWCQHRLTVSCA